MKTLKALKALLRQKDTLKKAIIIDLSLPAPLEPKAVFQYYMAIWKAWVKEEDIASTSTQYIVGRELFNNISS
jgi:hypothetical protein